MKLLIIGNPENRRVSNFQEEMQSAGLTPPLVFSHEDLLLDPERLLEIPDEPLLVRLESVGENPGAERRLLERGYPTAAKLPVWSMDPEELAARPERYGEILCPRQNFLGFADYINALARVFARRPNWFILNPPADVLAFFDKQTLLERYAANDVAVAPGLPPVSTPDELRERMEERDIPAVFVKLTCGSSASCLGLYHRRGLLVTTMLERDGHWFNSLRMQQLRDPAKINQTLEFLLSEGSRVEASIPKARLNGGFLDLRMLTVDGSVDFYVVRQNSHPITNLHLGGKRGDRADFEAACGPGVLEEAKALVRKTYALHNSFHLGVDLMLEPGFKNPRIIESNAFGDLLPNLEYQGRSVYGHQIEILKRKYEELYAPL